MGDMDYAMCYFGFIQDSTEWASLLAFLSKMWASQGDLLSPYLFILCMDIYSRMLTLGEDLNLFKGIKVARRSPSISHLFFADDALLFFKTSQAACIHLTSINNRFCFI